MSDPNAEGARPGEGALSFSHSGHRYILGYGRDFFGIWDREKPGGPVLRFPRTDEGWNQAWNSFVAWEPRNIEVPQAGTPPDARERVRPFTSAHAPAMWTVGLVLLAVLLALAAAGTWASHIAALSRFEGTTLSAELQQSEDRAEALATIMTVFIFVPGIAWLIWQHHAHRNLRALGATDLRYSPGWVAGWWFIPFANVVMPYLTMRELWKASDPEAGAVEWKMNKKTWLLPLWWGTWLGRLFTSQVGNFVGRSRSVSTLITGWAWFTGFAVFTAVAGILAITLVRSIDTRQERKHQRVVALSRGAPAA
ncbi:MAG TPA: DUF4328 domain-containing protein [Actinomycetota bacterium]